MSGIAQKLMQKSDDTAMNVTAAVFGIEESTVASIVHLGLPMQMQMIADQPDLARKMYAASFQMVPAEVQAFYKMLDKDPKLADVSREEYQQMFGASAELINATVAEAVDLSADDVAFVMGAMMPTLKLDLKEQATAEDVAADGFGVWIGERIGEEAR